MEKGTGAPDPDDDAAAAARPHRPLRAEPIGYGSARGRPRSPGQTFRGVLFAIAAGIVLLFGFMVIGTSVLLAGGRRDGWLQALTTAVVIGLPMVAVGVRWGWEALKELGAVRNR